MATLVDTGAREKLVALFSRLEEQIPEEALRPTAMAMAQDAASRAPTPAEEYNTMMFGGYDTTGFSAGAYLPGGQGAITDSDNRVRFFKPSSMFLRNYLPTSFVVEGLSAGVGYIPGLIDASSYTYVNYTKRNDQTYEHEVVFPFWEAWENGGVFRITPTHFGGRRYPLQPAPGVKTFAMTKTIPARQMFGAVNTDVFVQDYLIPRIRRIVQRIR